MARPRRPRGHRRLREADAPEYAPFARVGLNGVLFDSDVVIEILRGRGDIIQAARDLEGSGTPTFCTPISHAEVYAGLRPGEEEVTHRFFAARGEVVLDGAVGRRAGAYLARYARSHGVEIADALIGAAASLAGLQLWTLNHRHYPMADISFFGG